LIYKSQTTPLVGGEAIDIVPNDADLMPPPAKRLKTGE